MYRSTANQAETMRWVAHTHAVLAGIQELILRLTDAEAGRRGFIMTGRDRYLVHYTNAAEKVNKVLAELRERMRQFVVERDWEQFHSPKNLVMGLSCEAAELMEHFLWMDNDASRQVANDAAKREAIADEIADVACYLLAMSNSLGIDLSEAIRAKLAKNELKYPAEKYRGKYRLEE